MNRQINFVLVVTCFCMLLLGNCKKDQQTVKPQLTISPVDKITRYTAECNVSITSGEGVALHARGICYSNVEFHQPVSLDDHIESGNGAGDFTAQLTRLNPNTKYWVRAYISTTGAENEVVYSNTISFTTAAKGIEGTVKDIDGNVYKTITIGNQNWMAENLRVTHFRNGDSIPRFLGMNWGDLTTPAYCNWDDNESNAIKFGLYYNWNAVKDSRNIAPAGWHIPTSDDFKELDGMLTAAGSKMKVTGSVSNGDGPWRIPGMGGSNESGFSAYPVGFRRYDGAFAQQGYDAYFMISDGQDSPGKYFVLRSSSDGVESFGINHLAEGYSIRCIKDKD